MTAYFVLLSILINCVHAGIPKAGGKYITSHADDSTGWNISGLYRNLSGLYISVAEKQNDMILCGLDGTPRLESIYNASAMCSFNDFYRVPLRLSYSLFPMAECLNEANIQLGVDVMPKCIHFKLSNSAITKLRNFTFSNFAELRMLDLSYNNIRDIDYFAFSNLSKLEVLNLSNNRLKTLDITHFMSSVRYSTSSVNLSYISLVSNNFHTIECSARHNWTLDSYDSLSTTLNVSYNNISYISPSCNEIITKYYKNVTIILNGNPAVCNCSTKHNSSSGTTIDDLHDCTCEGTKRHTFDFLNLKLLYLELTSTECIIYFSLYFSIIVLFVAVLLNFKYRQTNELPPDSACNGTYCTNEIKNIYKDDPMRKGGGTFVYIVASPRDSTILDMFVEELETKRSIPIIFRERDEIPGYFKLELFRHWLSESKRTIFLISSNFFSDIDCTNVLAQAKAAEHTERRAIIIIVKLKENLRPEELLPLKDLCVQSFCLDYSPASVTTGEFWDKLVLIINNPDMHIHVSGV